MSKSLKDRKNKTWDVKCINISGWRVVRFAETWFAVLLLTGKCRVSLEDWRPHGSGSAHKSLLHDSYLEFVVLGY